ncbi:MAG: twin-arginine translocase TatA/TatE family subunit [Anaerolineales bacterium]|nr:twin-arginine translocase TatA/TatE family subunit [Anaerolineales bacterium]
MEILGIMGMQELLVILLLATIVLGPERMVRAAREMGKHARNLKSYFSALSEELKTELEILDEVNQVKSEVEKELNGRK